MVTKLHLNNSQIREEKGQRRATLLIKGLFES